MARSGANDPSLSHLLGRLALVDARADEMSGIEADVLYEKAEQAADAAAVAGNAIRLRELASTFSLEPVDVELLLVVLAPEIDDRFISRFAELDGEARRGRATVKLALALCHIDLDAPDGRRRLREGGPLIDGGLVVVDDADRPFPSRTLRVPDRVVMHLLGDDEPAPQVAGLFVEPPPCAAGDPVALARALSHGARLCYLRERMGSSGSALAAAAYREIGASVLALDLARLAPGADIAELARMALLEARLRGLALVVGPVERLAEQGAEQVGAFADRWWPVVLTGSRSWDPAWSSHVPWVVDVPTPSLAARAAVWRAALDGAAPQDLAVDDVVVSYRLRPEQIGRAARAAQSRAVLAGRPLLAEDLRRGARSQSAAGLERLATRNEPRAGWDDLILPAPTKSRLREIIFRTRRREVVLDRWGMRRISRRGEGLTALFTGPPGTGKTMAAEIIACELGLDLYVVDLATVVDKYIGETEKNLDRIFSEAEQVNGVLFFDEADALFGKRSEVRDAQDRYANVETAYLLQRMETFDGVAILTTNLRANIDEAFTRRLDAIVEFPMPDVSQRLLLWQRCLGSGVPLAADVDLEFCAEAFELSGGHIGNVALTAAYLAADGEQADTALSMTDIVVAVQREYAKLGRLCSAAEFGPYLDLLAAAPGGQPT